MAVTTIPWGDGSGDNIYLTYPSASGDQTIEVSSDAYSGSTDRTKTITFTASHHGTSDVKTLTVVQEGVPEQYIVFADPTVEAICAANWGDGIGITPSQAAAVSYNQSQTASVNNFWNKFTNAGTMTSFDELDYFTQVTSIPASKFKGNTSLTSIGLSNIKRLLSSCFENCSSLSIEVDMPNAELHNSYYAQFKASGITKIKNLGNTTYLANYEFARNCPNLTEVHLPSTLTVINRIQFWGCANLTTAVCLATTPPTSNGRIFDTSASLKIYVPYSADHSILDAYKAATGWKDNASQIYELNPDGTIPT